MRPLLASTLLILLLSSLARCWDCEGDDLTKCKCGTSLARRGNSASHLFSRTVETCSDGKPACCLEESPGPVQVSPSSGTVNLQCGSKFGDDSQDIVGGVVYEIIDCPPGTGSPGERCLHVKLSPASGDEITDIHLQLSTDPSTLTNKGLGNWPFNKYCKASEGECFVPLSAVPGGPDFCGDTLYAAAGISVKLPGGANGPTCFNKGSQGGTIGSGNWFLYVKLDLECPKDCTKSCCCPSTPPPGQICDLGTAYAKSPHDLKDYCGHWGWYFKDVTTGFGPVPLILGQNTEVGDLTVTIDAEKGLEWEYHVLPPNGIIEAHAEVLCSPPVCDGNGPCDPNVCAPGQFTDNSGCKGGSPGTGWTGSRKCPNGVYWLIFHAKIGGPVSSGGTCKAVVCPDPADA